MLCSQCKKNQATKAYEQIKKDKKAVVYYCLECYEKLFLCVEEKVGEKQNACPYCGTLASEIKRRNLVGCANCYNLLSSTVMPVVVKMQGCEVHKGKTVWETEEERIQRRCSELKTMAKKCYSENDYEGAREYERQIVLLKTGEEEEYSWRNRDLSKRS